MRKKQMRGLSICFFLGLSWFGFLFCKQETDAFIKIPKTLEIEFKPTNEKAENVIKHYKKFLKKKDMYAYTATKAYPRGDSKAKYAFGDINGDGVPELHLSGGKNYNIYTYKKGKVVLLCDLGWRYASITASKNGAIVVSGRVDEGTSTEGREEYKIPPKGELFAEIGQIKSRIDYYGYLKLDAAGKIIDAESSYFYKEVYKKRGLTKYTYYVNDKKCKKEKWEKKVEFCREIQKDESKQLIWEYLFPKEEWDYLDAMENGDGSLEEKEESEEWIFYKRILSGDFSLLRSSNLSLDDRAAIHSAYMMSLDKSSGRSNWKYILLDFNGDGIKDLFIQYDSYKKNYTSAKFTYSNVSRGVGFFSYADGKVDWWTSDGATGVRRIPLRNGQIIQMESYAVTTTLYFDRMFLRKKQFKTEKVYTIVDVDLKRGDSYNLEWYKEYYGKDREYKDGDTYYFVLDDKNGEGDRRELSKEEWEEVEKEIEKLLIPDSEWKPASVFLPNRDLTHFSVG